MFAFATILPKVAFDQLKISKSVYHDINQELNKLNTDGETYTILNSFINGEEELKSVALMFQGRFMNLPLVLIPNLHRQLLEDIQWSKSEEEKKKKSKGDASIQMVFSEIEYILLLSPCSRSG